MTYSPEPFLANIERIYAAQKCYYRRTCDARLSYQRATTIKIETKLDGKAETKTKFIDDKAEPNIEVNVFFFNLRSHPRCYHASLESQNLIFVHTFYSSSLSD
ncbi:hypothetical protein Plhal304r1_c078g0164511 [Plasmopara halstedii]